MKEDFFVILQRLLTKGCSNEGRETLETTLLKKGINIINFITLNKMHLSTEEKQAIFEKYGQGKNDTGSPESQIALFSIRIKHLTEHLKNNHKDHTTARALKALVGQRRSLLDYLIRKDINRYRAIIAKKELGIRR